MNSMLLRHERILEMQGHAPAVARAYSDWMLAQSRQANRQLRSVLRVWVDAGLISGLRRAA